MTGASVIAEDLGQRKDGQLWYDMNSAVNREDELGVKARVILKLGVVRVQFGHAVQAGLENITKRNIRSELRGSRKEGRAARRQTSQGEPRGYVSCTTRIQGQRSTGLPDGVMRLTSIHLSINPHGHAGRRKWISR